MPQPKGFDTKRLTIADRFLQPTIPLGNDTFYNLIKQIIGKELSVANLERTDLASYIWQSTTAQVFLLYGQERLSRFLMNMMISELKLTMSIGNEFAHLLFKDSLEYTTTQNVHEYSHQPQKRGFFGGFKGGN